MTSDVPGPGPAEPYDAVPPEPGRDDWRGRTGRLARRTVHGAVQGARTGVTALADRLVEAAPRIPVRDLEALRRQFPALGPEEIADKLVAGAVNATTSVGAAVGAVAMLPVPPALAAELATETLACAAVEYKLIAELHEVYGLRAPGNVKDRAAVYLAEWAGERGIQAARPSSLTIAFSSQAKRELRKKLLKRGVRHLPTLTPLMVGAAVGAALNRRDTRRVAHRIRADLRARHVPWEPSQPPEPPASAQP